MQADTRAMIAAAAFAFLTGRKVAGIYDHSAGRDRRIAAESRGDRFQGFDGDRAARFSGTLPEILDEAARSFISLERDGPAPAPANDSPGAQVRGFNRASGSFYHARVTGGVVQLFDHGEQAWFAYDVQDPDAAQAYHRETGSGA